MHASGPNALYGGLGDHRRISDVALLVQPEIPRELLGQFVDPIRIPPLVGGVPREHLPGENAPLGIHGDARHDLFEVRAMPC